MAWALRGGCRQGRWSPGEDGHGLARLVQEEVYGTPDSLDSAKKDGSAPGEWEADFLDSSGKPPEGFQ